MEPRQSGPGLRHEGPPLAQSEISQSGIEPDHDALMVSSPEKREVLPSRIEQTGGESSVPTLPTPILPQAAQDEPVSNAPVQDVTTLLAADEDLIEKEWVDKAKKIILDTKDDPYLREREISKLQVEYIRKRYGRVIGDSDV